MLKFQIIRWKNVLSTGNQFTQIQLDRSPSTVITGENGSGKSTISDALMFALYGKPLRNINKTQLINTINNKDLLVEIEFTASNVEYLVRRGMKPNIFEIYRNGSLVPQPAAIKDYQSYLENDVIKMSFKSFTQIVILGTASFTPFMQLAAADRRAVIEDLLDIQIFSKMNLLLKDRVSGNKKELAEIDFSIKLLSEKINMAIEYQNKIKKNVDDQIKKLDDEYANIESMRSSIAEKAKALSSEIEKMIIPEEKKTKLQGRISKINTLTTQLEERKRTSSKKMKFFLETAACPTCEQTIPDDLKSKNNAELEKIILELETALVEITARRDETNKEISELQEQQKIITNKQRELLTINTQVDSYSRELNRILNNKKSLLSENKTSDSGLDIESLR